MSGDDIPYPDTNTDTVDWRKRKTDSAREWEWWSPPEEGGGLAKLLVGKGSSQRTIPVDKKSLAFHSPYFRKRIQRDMNSELPEWIVLTEDDPAVIDVIVELITTGRLGSSSVPFDLKMAARVWEAANKFEMLEIWKRMRNFIRMNLHGVEDVVDVYEVARRIIDMELERMALEYIVPRFSKLLKTDAFLRLSRESVRKLLKHPDIVVESEHKVFNAVWKYAEAECVRSGWDSTNYLHQRYAMGDLCDLIHFPAIDPEVFRRTIKPTCLLENQDCELLEHYYNLLITDPIAAETMSLPFDKSKRTGLRYNASFFNRKASQCRWSSGPGGWIGLKFRSECSVTLHSLLLDGQPENNKKSASTHSMLFVKASVGKRQQYQTVGTQLCTIRITNDENSKLEFVDPVHLKAGEKYRLDINLGDLGCMDSRASKGRLLSMSKQEWKSVNVVCGNEPAFKIQAKKVKNLGDFYFHSLDFSLDFALDEDMDMFYVPRLKPSVSSRNSARFLCNII